MIFNPVEPIQRGKEGFEIINYIYIVELFHRPELGCQRAPLVIVTCIKFVSFICFSLRKF